MKGPEIRQSKLPFAVKQYLAHIFISSSTECPVYPVQEALAYDEDQLTGHSVQLS